DWPFYNVSLVRRGQVLLDFDVVDRWDQNYTLCWKIIRSRILIETSFSLVLTKGTTNLKIYCSVGIKSAINKNFRI
ncbi:MAG TPA: hypothetical protein VEL11_01475, partial [Candidatus Bathyarchaeia archaeon]|nr:hypothetical protein [Candidatus Bathyarchaeia archaeon]